MNVVLKLSKLCNLRCTYCYEYDDLADPARMPVAALRDFFAHLADYFRGQSDPPVLQFALHGGEPTLLPADYFRDLVKAQQQTLGIAGLRWRNDVQTNLIKLGQSKLALFAELDIGVSVSLDVIGGQRVNAKGQDVDGRAQDRLDELLQGGWADVLGLGGICVLHAGNAHQSVDMWSFFEQRKLAMRFLPVFSMAEPPARLRGLMLSPGQIVEALWAVMLARLSSEGGPQTTVYPLDDYMRAAVLPRAGYSVARHRPEQREWAVVVDTNGDTYAHCDAYQPGWRLGNAFDQPFDALMDSVARERSLLARGQRARFCDDCPHQQGCEGLPMIEALPSERAFNAQGKQECAVARPLIDRMAQLLAQFPEALADAQPTPATVA